MAKESVKMPDGSDFDFWDDATEYAKTFHVAREHPKGCDDNPGTEDLPFATIGRAAELLEPAQKVIVHTGVYRERVCPVRGGEGPGRMIAYEAAPGEDVCVKGSELIAVRFEPSKGWRGLERTADRPTVWMVDLPEEWFVGYNPFSARNIFPHFLTFISDWTDEETHRLLCRRGMVFADGRRLTQVFRPRELAETDGAFWVEEPGLRIHLRLWDDADPNDSAVEVTAREQVFAPRKHHLGYIRVSGFRFEHAGDGLPVPQRAMVSAYRGHHWIIEDNTIRHANSTGLDLGKEDWSAVPYETCGRHVVRRNTIADCGICGIAGADCVDGSLIEDNLIESIGWQDIERLLECAGLKFHEADNVLLRRNVFRHITNAGGMWLDVKNRNCRITRNIFADIASFHAGMMLECSHDPDLIDGNIFWDIRDTSAPRSPEARQIQGGVALDVDTCENTTAAHNFFGKVHDHFAVSMHLRQYGRMIGDYRDKVGGRGGLCRRHKLLNNVFFDCPRQVIFGRTEENASDGNLFDEAHDTACLRIDYPPPQTHQNLEGWKEYYGLDAHSTRAAMTADFDPDTLTLTWKVNGPLPECPDVPELHGVGEYAGPGPLNAAQWKQLAGGEKVTVTFDLPGAKR